MGTNWLATVVVVAALFLLMIISHDLQLLDFQKRREDLKASDDIVVISNRNNKVSPFQSLFLHLNDSLLSLKDFAQC